MTGLGTLGAEAVLSPDIWNPANYRALSEDTDDPQRLLFAALHAFTEVNAAGSRFKYADVKRSADLIGRAYRVTRRRDPVITTMYAMITLWAAGRSERLTRRIHYSTTGINAFDNAKALAPDNLEVRALRLISSIGVPTSFRDLTESLVADGEWFLARGGAAGATDALSEVERAVWESYLPAVAVVMAECMARGKNGEKVREYLDLVPPGGALDSPRFANIQALHERLIDEWR